MDKRKIEAFKKVNQSTEDFKINQIINSTKVNEALLDNVEHMFELEFVLKQRA